MSTRHRSCQTQLANRVGLARMPCGEGGGAARRRTPRRSASQQAQVRAPFADVEREPTGNTREKPAAGPHEIRKGCS